VHEFGAMVLIKRFTIVKKLRKEGLVEENQKARQTPHQKKKTPWVKKSTIGGR